MSDIEAAFREAGILRDTGWATLCAAEPCDLSARVDVLHSPADDPAALWVPLCDLHWRASCQGKRIEYVVECHGFVGGVS